MELERVVDNIAAALVAVDRSGIAFKHFQPGVGPYGEPQLLAAVAKHLNTLPAYGGTARTKRAPDLLLPREWALEVKLARPFGDNGYEAENWSVNLLHPYEGNVSLIGDCLKLHKLGGPERKARSWSGTSTVRHGSGWLRSWRHSSSSRTGWSASGLVRESTLLVQGYVIRCISSYSSQRGKSCEASSRERTYAVVRSR
jgi:hypothetical protein